MPETLGRVELVVGDICDAELLDKIALGHHAVAHCAAESYSDNSIADPEPFFHTNVEDTFRLLEAVREHGVRYRHVSVDGVYGDLALDNPARSTESTPHKPSSPYLSTEAAATCWCASGRAPTVSEPPSPAAPTTATPTST